MIKLFLKNDKELGDFTDIGRSFHVYGHDTANGLQRNRVTVRVSS